MSELMGKARIPLRLSASLLINLSGELEETFGGSMEFVCPEGEVDCIPPKGKSERS